MADSASTSTWIYCYLFKLYAKSYSSEKGKNLATKEDISEITEIVESIKTSLSNKTEELKSDYLIKMSTSFI